MKTTTRTSRGRRIAAAVVATTALGLPAIGAAVALAGPAAAMPPYGWCWEEVQQPDGTWKMVKVACEAP